MGRLCTSSAWVLTFLLTLSLFPSPSIQKNCTYPDGTVAANYYPCDPNASKSACCLENEVCLTSGLCFGGAGLPYRGACYGGWTDTNICPDYCKDMEGSTNRFVNIWPCEGLGRDAPNAFWCGNNGGVPCNTTSDTGPDNGAMITLGLLHDSFIYKTVATAVPTSGATSTTSIPSGTVTSRETSSTAPVVTDCPADTSSSTPAEEDTGKLVAVGAGVGAPLFIMAMIMGGWAFRERAKRRTMVKQMEEYNAAAAAASAARYAHPDHRRQNYIAELQAEPAEMPATEIDAELDASGRKSIRTSLRTSFRTKR